MNTNSDLESTGESTSRNFVELECGEIIQERYQVIHLLGRGGMGSVYKVEDIRTKSFYALKFLNKQQSNDSAWKRFENEIKATNKLDHPNLVKVHESGLLPNGQPYFIMDLIQGESLAQILRKSGRLPLEKVLKIFVQVGFALSYAHSKGIIHRDIKPSNIMLHHTGNQTTSGSVVKVVDFGIAKLSGKDDFNQQTLTKTGEIFGSPLYMSPEQCMGGAIDPRTDLYSMGCVIYEALTGAPPLVGDSALSTMMKHQSEAALPLKEASLGIDFPEGIEQIVSKLLAKDVKDRYQSAQLVTSHLAACESIPGTKQNNGTEPQKILLLDWKLGKQLTYSLGAIFFAAGIAIGYFHPEHKNTYEKKRPEFSKPVQEKLKESLEENRKHSIRGIEKSSNTVYAEYANNPAKFSEYKEKYGRRIFHFPPDAIGRLGFIDTNDEPAVGDIVSPPVFQGIKFCPFAEMRAYPQFLKRFRDDDIQFLDLFFSEDRAMFMDKKEVSVDRLIPYVIKLKSIQKLSLDNTTILPENFNMLKELPQLRHLWLSNINLTGEQVVQSQLLGKLESLTLKNMRNVASITKEIGKSRKIQELIMRESNVDVDAIKPLVHCNALKVLDVRGNPKFNDECLKLVPKGVTKLILYFCDLTPLSIDEFKRFNNLQVLMVTTDKWKPEDFKRLKETLPSTEIRH